MRVSVNVCLDQKLLNEIDKLRGREKRSIFVEHLLKLGIKTTRKKTEPPKRRNGHDTVR